MAGRRRHPGRCRRRRGRRGRWPVRSDARQDHRARARPGRCAGPADAGARRDRRAGSDHEPAVPALAGPRAGGPRRRGPHRHARTGSGRRTTGQQRARIPRRGLVGRGARAARRHGGRAGTTPRVRRLPPQRGPGDPPRQRRRDQDRSASPRAAPGRGPRSSRAGDTVHLDFAGRSTPFRVAPPPDVDRAASAAAAPTAAGRPELVAPMPGQVLTIHVAVGSTRRGGRPGRDARGDEDGARRRAPAAGRVDRSARRGRRPGRARPARSAVVEPLTARTRYAAPMATRRRHQADAPADRAAPDARGAARPPPRDPQAAQQGGARQPGARRGDRPARPDRGRDRPHRAGDGPAARLTCRR